MNLFFEDAVEKEMVLAELRAVLGRKDESEEMKKGLKKAILCVEQVSILAKVDV